MAAKRKNNEKAPKSCEECSRWKDIKPRLRISELLGKAISKFEKKLDSDDFKPTVGDYVKLVQMEQEFEKETEAPKEIKVTWVEPALSTEE